MTTILKRELERMIRKHFSVAMVGPSCCPMLSKYLSTFGIGRESAEAMMARFCLQDGFSVLISAVND